MPDPSEPDDGLVATRHGDEPTHAKSLQATEVGEADPLEKTEVDPYATALPSVMTGEATDLGSPEKTIEDPYSTRFTEVPTGVGGTTERWAGGGERSSTIPKTSAKRYHPLRSHAKGGLGEVFLAVDAELNREVALKEIQERHSDKADSQFRFIFEAEVTGGLEHPGIVPVYGLGRYPDGRPYYAMRFIRGDSLKAAIKKFHDRPKVSNLAHSLEFRQIVARFVAVCQAIDYAHGRGVLHRDIKPDNIMLGPHGETLVVDWGLAKALNRPDPVEPHALKPLRPLSGSDTSATMEGSVMGTPSFMSPEQAAGEVETLGPASDIFSLGSTLYALITGQAPFRGMGLTELIECVRKAEFPAPRGLNHAIPPALEAICLKAMARQPVDRYPTAAALADDLDRWLADDPVLAYPEPWTVRLSRWARRHRTAVAATFALLLTASTALGISTVLIGREQAKTERNYRRARSAVEQMLTKVGEVDLADIPQMESVRRDLLDRALGFYREFLADRGANSSSGPETGRALARLGEIRELLGQYVQAEKDDREALALLGGPKGDLETRRALARTRANLGILLKKSNRFAESEVLLREALVERRAIVAEHPDDTDDARAVSSTLYQLGTLLTRLAKRSDEDETLYRQAIDDQKALVGRPSASPEARRELARYLNNLAILQAGSDFAEAEASLRQAFTIQEELQASSANNAGFRWQRARTWNNLANLYARGQLPKDAEPAYLKARVGFEGLAADFPKVPDYRRELAMTLNNLAQLLEVNPSGSANPLDLLRQALDDQVRLVEEFPEVPDHRMKLAVTRLHLGDLLRSTAPAEADVLLAEAVAIQEALVGLYPQVPEYQATLGRALTEQARSKAVQGNQAESLKLLTPAIDALERARSGNPRDRNYVRFLFDARDDRARVLLKLGRHADLALEAGQLARIAPDRPEGPLAAAGFLARCFEMAASDTALADPKRRDLQETYALASLEFLKDALKRGASDPSILDGPDLKPLKARPDFEKLRQDWLAKGQKAVG